MSFPGTPKRKSTTPWPWETWPPNRWSSRGTSSPAGSVASQAVCVLVGAVEWSTWKTRMMQTRGIVSEERVNQIGILVSNRASQSVIVWEISVSSCSILCLYDCNMLFIVKSVIYFLVNMRNNRPDYILPVMYVEPYSSYTGNNFSYFWCLTLIF